MPTPVSVLQRPALGALAYEYFTQSEAAGFIGSLVMPVFPTALKSADYPIIPTETLLKTPVVERAARGTYARDDWQYATGTYSCVEYGFEDVLDESERALTSSLGFFDAEIVGTERAVGVLLRSQEARVAGKLFSTSNACGNAAVSIEWSTFATCTPKADVAAGISAMRASGGLLPNALVMSYTVFNNLLRCTELKTYLQYTTPHLLTGVEAQKATLAAYFGVDKVLVGNGVKDGAKKGQATTIVDLWDDEYVALCRLSDGGADLKEPAFGRTFLWTSDTPQAIVVESYQEPSRRATIIRVRQHVAEAVICKGANYLLSNITA